MGTEARWVCHDCKTVCNRGGRPLLMRTSQRIRRTGLIDSVDATIAMVADLAEQVEFDQKDEYVSFLSDLKKWLSRHEGHSIHVGSDYTTDMMDLDSFYNETVDGRTSEHTRLELQTRSAEDWRRSRIGEIGKVINKHAPEIKHGNTGTTANELYQLFENWGLSERCS